MGLTDIVGEEMRRKMKMMEINTTELKDRLRMIAGNQLEVGDGKVQEYTYEMLPHIGSIDPELRDTLIYSLLSSWIINCRVNPERMKEMVMQCLDEHHLFLNIGESGTDSVFTRSFAGLIITSILYCHNHVSPFLEGEELTKIKEAIFSYANLERDFRGYVPDKGWAHSVAHLADCLAELSSCSYIKGEDLKQILCSIHTLMRTRDIAFVYGEDERMVRAILSIINKHLLDKEVVLDWIYELSQLDMNKGLPNDTWHVRNIKIFLRSLYFRTLEDVELNWVCEASLQGLKDISLKGGLWK
jgi:hypothetical protein